MLSHSPISTELDNTTDIGPEKFSVFAVIVTYDPELQILEESIKSICSQTDRLIIVDNGSKPNITTWLDSKHQIYGFELICCQENLGIGKGFNIGIEWSIQNNCTHVLLLDQDSIPAPDMVSNLIHSYIYLDQRKILLAAIGPAYINKSTGDGSYFVQFGFLGLKRIFCPQYGSHTLIPVDFLISSGSLIPKEAILKIGKMDEALFIDHVDTDWFMRARSMGYKSFGSCDAVMTHCLGDKTLRIWLWRWRNIAFRSPIRHYYMFRNSVLLAKKKYTPKKWLLNRIFYLLGLFFLFSLISPPRFQNIVLIMKGVKDGILGRSGKYSKDIKSKNLSNP